MTESDPRRSIPRTDHLLALPEVVAAAQRLGQSTIKAVIAEAQSAARDGRITPAEVAPTVIDRLGSRSASSLTPVLNATGIIVHTNLGRAPLSEAAQRAVADAAGYVDVEMDLATGKRSKRGMGAKQALLRACPAAEDALIVNNGAAALLLAVTALRADHSSPRGHRADPSTARGPRADGPTAGSPDAEEIIVSRGELIEIGAGFRLPDLMTTTGARLREVGTTNRTHLADYAEAISEATASLLKVHTSNFRVEGFTADVEIAGLRTLADEHGLPLIADLGSGLFDPDDALPDEPDIAGALRAGADVVIVSGDKLLGGPQAGLILGRTEAVQAIATHPLARAMRTDKLTLAALEATVAHAQNPVRDALHIDLDRLQARTVRLAESTSGTVVAHDGHVGGGGAPGVPLPGWTVELPEAFAEQLRLGDPAIVARVHQGRCLIDLRCVPEGDDDRIAEAIARIRGRSPDGEDGHRTPPRRS
ncbi:MULTISPECIES: L-seryl-tRNA(Sec) selenium transferase [unclassified Brevibacterium]|uniref:L-seryl-tRNA(Sec) selenium transferase n=1 Tax=unclassified Brevibacterium TaxID=2614124 RepID=UPI001E2910A6|nr:MULTISPECIES: L-seryl-tRNA(Sec) selenium transferase [unclassified Brevibacterium]MCD1286458.1 L-seryl-tRNA(Sec) selenium transferase [Brevibacterium sp. CCUG 69071]MDK8433825.1 L-seryl-tRNA(Sec) selenium transferase [Brevibacterium sp. H-BE7]